MSQWEDDAGMAGDALGDMTPDQMRRWSDGDETIKNVCVERVLAHLLRNEGVEPGAIERAVSSAVTMKLGEVTTLTGGDEELRRAFVWMQSGRLK